MHIYIAESAAISAQDTFENDSFLEHLLPLDLELYKVVHPVYKDYIPARFMRRMSTIVRMGTACANALIKDKNVPDAIVIGTSLGCLCDTEKFLHQMVTEHERLLNPTAFIQSTHNTVSGQIAMLNSCNSHNLTFSHGRHSFDQALLEAIMLLDEPDYQYVLVGALDEITVLSNELIGAVRKESSPKQRLGEGASFFNLTSQKNENNCAEIIAHELYVQHEGMLDLLEVIDAFLQAKGVKITEIDVVLFGDDERVATLFPMAISIAYRSLVGRYDTDAAFALFLAAKILHQQQLPVYLTSNFSAEIRYALVVNETNGKVFSLSLLKH